MEPKAVMEKTDQGHIIDKESYHRFPQLSESLSPLEWVTAHGERAEPNPEDRWLLFFSGPHIDLYNTRHPTRYGSRGHWDIKVLDHDTVVTVQEYQQWTRHAFGDLSATWNKDALKRMTMGKLIFKKNTFKCFCFFPIRSNIHSHKWRDSGLFVHT